MVARDQFLAERDLGIGGSDAGAVLGVNPYATRMDVYLRLTGQLELEADDTDGPRRWGQLLEPAILQHYQQTTGIELWQPGHRRSEFYPFMVGHLDARARDRVVDAKNYRSRDGWGEPGTDEVPLYIVAQMHHYMILEQVARADVAALFGGSDFATYTVSRDDELANMLIGAERDLWQHVQNREPPPPQSLAEVNALYRRSLGRTVDADEAIAQAVAELRGLRAMAKDAATRAEKVEATIKAFMGEAEALLIDGKPAVTWKSTKESKRIDVDALRQCHPAIAERFAVTAAGTRPFKLKKERAA